MTGPADAPLEGPTDEDDDDDASASAQGTAASTRTGRRRRRKVAQLLEQDPVITGSMDLMAGGEGRLHRLVLKGQRLTQHGGPAREVIALVERITESLEAIMPSADPHLGLVRGSNSIEVNFYAPEEEVAAARTRRASIGAAPGAEALPDTTLAVLALADIVRQDDPREAAYRARRISQETADEIRDLALEIAETNVVLEIDDVVVEDEETVRVSATPGWATHVVEQLDAEEEVDPATVTVTGVLQGANSGGEGTFELVTDDNLLLPPELGTRRRPGAKISGSLTPQARKQIREGNLWDTHVEASVQVIRRRYRDRIRIEGFRLLSVTARFHET